MARHEAGETLASIARTYDCSPPAISYIVSRSRARNTVAPEATSGPVSIGEPQLIKTHTTEAPVTAVSERQPLPSETPAPSAPAPREAPERPAPRFVAEQGLRLGEPRPDTRPRDGNGNGSHGRYFAPQPDAAAERERAAADARRTLHLSLGNGGDHSAPPNAGADRQPLRQPQAPPPPRPAAAPYPPASSSAAPARALPEQPKAREGGAIDHALRERVQADTAAFLAAFDQALAGDTAETRAGLREATDRLLRAGARTRIELERLEARVPLARERREAEPVEWRHR
jgi:hypothetical protein